LTVAEHQTLLGSILEECDRLTRLTEQLLTLAREDVAGAGQLLQPLDLAALVMAVVENLRPLAEMRGLSLRLQGTGPLRIVGNENRLRQVFYNVLDNAIKYTPGGGTITVRYCRQEGTALVAVSDTGLG